MTQADENNTSNILQEIWQNGQLAWRLYADPRVSFLLKAMVPALWLAYFILPIDLVPDLIPVLGQLDDIAVLLLLVRFFISLAPPEIVAEHRGEAPAGSAGPDAQQASGASGASRNWPLSVMMPSRNATEEICPSPTARSDMMIRSEPLGMPVWS